MFRARIFNDKYIIFDLHGEEVFLNIGKKTPYNGIYINHISNKPLDNIKNIIHNIDQEHVIIDFNHLKSVQQNQKDTLKYIIDYLLNNGKKFYLAYLNKTIKKQLKLSEILSVLDINDSEIIESDEILRLVESLDIKDYGRFKKDLFNEILIKYLKKESNDYNKSHSSSPVRLAKYIDIKGLIHRKIFFYYGLYTLALEIEKNGFISKESNIVLFCQTLNGAFVGSFLADILRTDIIFLDHIGPINKLYGAHLSKRIEPNKEYVVISDVVCLGTEINIAKNIIEYRGGEYKGNINIVRIKTLKNLSYKDEYSLYILEPDNNVLEYKIEMDI